VRASKFRHVHGATAKKENTFDCLKVSKNAWDSNLISANAKFFAVNWEAAGGGALCVNPLSNVGRLQPPKLVNGHTGAVLDSDWCPSNDNVLASSAEDGHVMVWNIPDGVMTEDISTPARDFTGHQKKVGCVKWNPTTSGILASAAADKMLKVWDVDAGSEKFSFDQHGDMIQSFDWHGSGDLLASSCKDKTIRLIDPRANKVAAETQGHQGMKGSRIWFMSSKNQIGVVGFNGSAERTFFFIDQRNFNDKLCEVVLDNGAGYIMPFWDDDCGVLYLAGKGDGTVLYYEALGEEKPHNFFLSKYTSNSPQKGMCMLPKKALNLKDCEVMRCLKIHNNNLIEPISWIVPRKMETFQDDIFPDMVSGEPSQTSTQWLAGTTNAVKRMSARDLFASGYQAQAATSLSSSSAGGGSHDKVAALEARVAELEKENAQLKAKLGIR